MRILDENDQEVVDPDLDLGHLEPDKLFIAHHEEVPEKLPVKKIDYDNPYYVDPNTGGKLVNAIEVSPYQPYEQAWDEYEDILRYILYTEEELAEIEAQKKAEEEAQKEAEEQAKKEAQEQEVERQIQAQMRTAAMFSVMAMALTDEQANEVSILIPEWTVGNVYKEDDITRYNGALYRALQNSTAQEQYPPNQYTAGWKRIGEPNEDGGYPWVQPLGATDAYNTGDEVTYQGGTYESTIDGNVWPPDVYPAGWKLVEDDPEPEPEPEETPEWVQPTGAHDAYAKDSIVMHNGKKWKSDVDGNVWEPGVYGWTDITE